MLEALSIAEVTILAAFIFVNVSRCEKQHYSTSFELFDIKI